MGESWSIGQAGASSWRRSSIRLHRLRQPYCKFTMLCAYARLIGKPLRYRMACVARDVRFVKGLDRNGAREAPAADGVARNRAGR